MPFGVRLGGIVFLVVIASRALPASPLYSFSTFQVPGSLAGTTSAYGINDLGQITGPYYDIHESLTQGFVRSPDGSHYDIFHVPIGFGETWVHAINNSGVVAGYFYEKLGDGTRGFTRSSDGSTYIPIEIPGGGDQQFVLGINDSGTLVGSLQYPVIGIDIGFVLSSDGVLTTFSVPGVARTYVGGINNAGTVVGSFDDANGQRHGYLRSPDGDFTIFDVPGFVGNTQPEGINNLGDVVGTAGLHGFLRTADGTFVVLDVPGSPRTFAFDINDNGQIVGTSLGGAFVATPIPEPALRGLFLVFVAFLICKSRLRAGVRPAVQLAIDGAVLRKLYHTVGALIITWFLPHASAFTAQT
jgi:probable HAF family extracellular repeat protein